MPLTSCVLIPRSLLIWRRKQFLHSTALSRPSFSSLSLMEMSPLLILSFIQSINPWLSLTSSLHDHWLGSSLEVIRSFLSGWGFLTDAYCLRQQSVLLDIPLNGHRRFSFTSPSTSLKKIPRPTRKGWKILPVLLEIRSRTFEWQLKGSISMHSLNYEPIILPKKACVTACLWNASQRLVLRCGPRMIILFWKDLELLGGVERLVKVGDHRCILKGCISSQTPPSSSQFPVHYELRGSWEMVWYILTPWCSALARRSHGPGLCSLKPWAKSNQSSLVESCSPGCFVRTTRKATNSEIVLSFGQQTSPCR